MIGGSYIDPQTYVDYYKHQAGNGLPGFHGTPTMYGSGFGGIFKALFRMAVPLIKRGITIVKPHLKTAAKGIVTDVVSNIVSNRASQKQEGSGLAAITRKNTRRPPGRRIVIVNKKRKTSEKKVRLTKTAKRKSRKRSPSFSFKRRNLNIF
nr:TPA_asm: cupiennin [Astyanax tetra cavefish adintovirus]